MTARTSLSADGLDELQACLAALSATAKGGVADALEAVATEMAAEARRLLARPGPSAPGDPPGDANGALAASLAVSVDRDALRATLSCAAAEAVDLEYGTRAMAARPFLRPAVAAEAENARARLRTALARAVARSQGGPT